MCERRRGRGGWTIFLFNYFCFYWSLVSVLRPGVFTLLYVIVQYLAGCRDSNPSCCNRSQVCYQWQWASHIPNELHTSLMSYTHNLLIIFCKTARGARCGFQFSTKIAELGKRNNCCAISHYRWTRCQNLLLTTLSRCQVVASSLVLSPWLWNCCTIFPNFLNSWRVLKRKSSILIRHHIW